MPTCEDVKGFLKPTKLKVSLLMAVAVTATLLGLKYLSGEQTVTNAENWAAKMSLLDLVWGYCSSSKAPFAANVATDAVEAMVATYALGFFGGKLVSCCRSVRDNEMQAPLLDQPDSKQSKVIRQLQESIGQLKDINNPGYHIGGNVKTAQIKLAVKSYNQYKNSSEEGVQSLVNQLSRLLKQQADVIEGLGLKFQPQTTAPPSAGVGITFEKAV